MSEIIVMKEGSFAWVQASAPASTAWNTASAPQSGFVGFVDSLSFTSARQLQVQYERGLPNHIKETQRDAIQVTVNFRWTGYDIPIASADGATMQLANFEFRASQDHLGDAPTGRYFQFYGAALQSVQWSEGQAADTKALTFMALGMSGENASGYLGNHIV